MLGCLLSTALSPHEAMSIFSIKCCVEDRTKTFTVALAALRVHLRIPLYFWSPLNSRRFSMPSVEQNYQPLLALAVEVMWSIAIAQLAETSVCGTPLTLQHRDNNAKTLCVQTTIWN
jgi:hypothetical protein